MKYYYALYMDEYAKEKQADIIKKIENDNWHMNIYLVALTKNEKNAIIFTKEFYFGE